MRRLYLLRHGKSPHPPGVADWDRPLTAKAGRRLAVFGRNVAREWPGPGCVLSSPTLRAAETARIVCEAAGWPAPVLLPELYVAEARDLLGIVRSQGGEVEAVLLVGHNPSLEDLCLQLGTPPLPDRHLSPGAMAVYACDIEDWGQLQPGGNRLEAVLDSR